MNVAVLSSCEWFPAWCPHRKKGHLVFPDGMKETISLHRGGPRESEPVSEHGLWGVGVKTVDSLILKFLSICHHQPQ
jgi:hypothetical protein